MTTYYAKRDFSDAGTERQFLKDQVVDAKPGEIVNYKAAGLITTEKPAAKPAQVG